MKKRREYNFKITQQDQAIIKILREKYSVNISNLLRTTLRDLYEKFSK